ncbi:MAG: glycosyltransferase, partial [Pseudomonadota bacterium]|nr:glycosyltransferase [Pseudomonadota bacterium]
KKYLVGYVGVIGEQEGLNYLVDSAHYIVHELKRTDIHFGVVGGGTSLEDIKKYAASMGVTDYFTFTGRVSDRELLEMLNTSDVCVNTDVANDMNDKSTMNKIMEYMALGKPIVQFDLTEGRFSAQDASLYAARNDPVDFAHNILKLVDDETLRSRMGAFGQERIRNHLEWKYEAPKLLGAYNALFGLANR